MYHVNSLLPSIESQYKVQVRSIDNNSLSHGNALVQCMSTERQPVSQATICTFVHMINIVLQCTEDTH